LRSFSNEKIYGTFGSSRGGCRGEGGAQEKAKNTFTGGLDLGVYTGFSLDYECVLIDDFLGKGQLAVGVEAGYDSFLFFLPLAFFDVQVKWYP
jgi:hypothetical protein